MAEKDESPREEVNRNQEKETGSTAPDLPLHEEKGKEETPVKNANAAGMGAMGKNDETDLGSEAPVTQEDTHPY